MNTPDSQSYQLPLLPSITFGAYPGHYERSQAIARVSAYCQAGASCFIDITEDRDGLDPYATLFPEVLPAGASLPIHLRFPIRDQSVPSDPADMLVILDALDAAVAEGHQVYLHCWGGIGRTGMVAGCYLVRHGLTGELALKEIARLFARTPLGLEGRRSPENDLQRRFVRQWPKHDPKSKWPPSPGEWEKQGGKLAGETGGLHPVRRIQAERYARYLIAEAGGDMAAAGRAAEVSARNASLDGPQWAGAVWALVVELIANERGKP